MSRRRAGSPAYQDLPGGILSSATAFVTGPNGFYALRILTSAVGDGLCPCVLSHPSTWSQAQQRVRLLAGFPAVIPLSPVVGGLLSVSLLKLDGMLSFLPRRWLFLAEGFPACIVGGRTLLFSALGHTPSAATAIVTLWGMFAFAVCAITQAMAVEAARTAPNLASTLNIGAFDLGNAIGAGLSAAALSAGLGLPAVPLLAAGVATLAATTAGISASTARDRSRSER